MSIDRTKDAALKAIAGQIKRLSYEDMTKLAGMIENGIRSDFPNDVPAILLTVSDSILGPDYNPHASATRG